MASAPKETTLIQALNIEKGLAGISALVAYKINHKVKDYLIFSHISTEPGFKLIEKAMEEKAPLNFNMCLGEGSGCPLMFKMIDSSVAVIKRDLRK